MTSIVKPEQSKSAAVRASLPPEIQAKIDENRARNVMVAQIRGTQWAKDCSEQVIRAVAEYAHRYGIDPVSELEILGGRLYKTASYYERKGAELMQSGVIARIETDHVEADTRLEHAYEQARRFAKDAAEASDAPEGEAAYWSNEASRARREIQRRTMERIRWNAPEKAAAVVVTRIYLAGAEQPIEGCNWCGNGVRPRDPVGDAEPSKTAETRSARRAWKKLVTSEVAQRDPRLAAVARIEGKIGEEGAALAEVIEAERVDVAQQIEAARPHAMLQTPKDDPYGHEIRDSATAPVSAHTSVSGDQSSTASGAEPQLFEPEPRKRRTSIEPEA
jgi:hypothetical protein